MSCQICGAPTGRHSSHLNCDDCSGWATRLFLKFGRIAYQRTILEHCEQERRHTLHPIAELSHP